jgi:hypothetical protein
MALQRNQKDATFDYLLRMKDAGVIGATAAAQVGGADKILDMGPQRFDGRVIVDITECEVGTGNEGYKIWVQGSNSATFADTIFILGGLSLGDSSVSLESTDTAATRHQEIAFCNEVNGVVYRYIRLYTVVIGTVATGIGYTANLVPKA